MLIYQRVNPISVSVGDQQPPYTAGKSPHLFANVFWGKGMVVQLRKSPPVMAPNASYKMLQLHLNKLYGMYNLGKL